MDLLSYFDGMKYRHFSISLLKSSTSYQSKKKTDRTRYEVICLRAMLYFKGQKYNVSLGRLTEWDKITKRIDSYIDRKNLQTIIECLDSYERDSIVDSSVTEKAAQ